ncbi:MAG: sigma-70 family RNA polymerase sigma factor [Acutalibacteraceae bacterium]|nr:sigma-70 family RNA polymerase sigma factor [Acutalibacteraceae bacterium]
MLKDKSKRDAFIENNLGLVHSICKRFCGRGIEYDDLYQAGCMGLVKAADGFDSDRGLMFSTYAVPVIMGEVRRLFRDGGAVKVSRSVKELGLKINREKQILEQKLCREPTVAEIAAQLGVSSEEVTEAVCAAQNTVSLTYDGDDGVRETDLPTVSTEDEISDRLVLEEAFTKLNEKERMIMECRYYRYMTQSNTAKVLNMTQVQVSRAEKKILIKLRGLLG